jgi:iron complex transport system substrate-binding protein
VFPEEVRVPRVVSLIASATEIVCALDREADLVGRSHECDFPPSVRRLPVCTAPRFDVEGSGAAIDRRVKAVLQEGLSVYRVHADLLRQLRPDVLITQSQCEVCAVSVRDVEKAVGDWLEGRPRVVALAPNILDDVWADIERVAEALGVPQRGRELVGRLRARVAEIEARVRSLSDRPRVACIEWAEPLMAAGNWVPELVTLAGGDNLFGTAGKHAPGMTWDHMRASDPEVIVVMPCGFDIARSRQEMPVLAAQPGWEKLSAVRHDCVFLADGNQYFNRPGPRLVESLEILAELFHPAVFRFGHGGTGWEKYPNEGATG